MRSIVPVTIFFIITALLAGCTQPTPVITPAPTQTPDTTSGSDSLATITPTAQRQIDVTATQSGSDIIVKYRGGPDAGELAALDIWIGGRGSDFTTEREDNPVIGQEFIFPHKGTPEPDPVRVTGIFRDGNEQLLLTTSV